MPFGTNLMAFRRQIDRREFRLLQLPVQAGTSRVLISFQRASRPASVLSLRRRRRPPRRPGVRALDHFEKRREVSVGPRQVVLRGGARRAAEPAGGSLEGPALPSRAPIASAAAVFPGARLERLELGRGVTGLRRSAVKSSCIAAQICVASSNCRARSAAGVLTRGSIATVSGCVRSSPPAVSLTVYCPGRTHGPRGWRGVSW